MEYIRKAFISCSLREEDKPFINFVEQILKAHRIEPVGTVGKYSASHRSVSSDMKSNMISADMVVIIVTPRYLQKDLKTGKTTNSMSEMIQVELGMAFMSEKPIVVFVKENTDVGNFIPYVTQYITLRINKEHYNSKKKLIGSLLINAIKSSKKIPDNNLNNDGVFFTS